MNAKKALGTGLVAVGCLIAAAAQAGQMSLSSTTRRPPVPVYRFVRPNNSVFPVTDAAHVKLNKLTAIDGWALIDETACVELGTESDFAFPIVPHGAFSSSILKAHLGDGNCPSTLFDFAEVDFTWTDGSAPIGAAIHARGRSVITGIDKRVYGISKAVIEDHIVVRYNGR
jgi:hypothetical protein